MERIVQANRERMIQSFLIMKKQQAKITQQLLSSSSGSLPPIHEVIPGQITQFSGRHDGLSDAGSDGKEGYHRAFLRTAQC